MMTKLPKHARLFARQCQDHCCFICLSLDSVFVFQTALQHMKTFHKCDLGTNERFVAVTQLQDYGKSCRLG